MAGSRAPRRAPQRLGSTAGVSRRPGTPANATPGRDLILQLQRSIGNHAVMRYVAASARTAPLIQRATDEQKDALAKRLNVDRKVLDRAFTFHTNDAKQEFADGPGGPFQLIKFQSGDFQWRKIKRRVGGKGFYGRLADNPPSMKQLAEDINYFGAFAEGRPSGKSEFKPSASVSGRDNNNKVMGKHFLGGGELSASVYAQRSDCEWLHLHGHGLGGFEESDNLYAGSHSANSRMAAVETALQKLLKMFSGKLSVSVSVWTDEDYHNEGTCAAIAKFLTLDAKEVYQRMKSLESRMLTMVVYDVAVDGRGVWSEPVNPFQEGRFDDGQFKLIQQRVEGVIKGETMQPRFEFGELL